MPEIEIDIDHYDQPKYRDTPLCPTKRGRRGLARKEIHAALIHYADEQTADKLAQPTDYVDGDHDRRIWSSGRQPTAFETLARQLRDEYLPDDWAASYTSRW